MKKAHWEGGLWSLQLDLVPKLAMGGTWVAIAAMAPCLERFEITLRPGQKEAPSVVTPASRSPMCDVIRVLPVPVIHFMTAKCTTWTFVIHVHANMGWWFFFILKWAFTGQLALCNKENVVLFLSFFYKFPVFWEVLASLRTVSAPPPMPELRRLWRTRAIYFYILVCTPGGN